MDCPKISVIVPIYNVEDYLEECLDSLENQHFGPLEIIMVNDGSTDSSGEIAKARAAKDSSFRYFERSNHGLGATRNFALTQATGKYVTFCDADDVIPPFAYKHMYTLAEKHGCDVVMGSMGRFNSEKRMPSRLHRKAFVNLDEVVHLTTHPQLIYNTTSCNNLYNREFAIEAGLSFPEGMLFEDMPATTRVHYLAKKCAFLDEVVYMWRIRDRGDQSITQDKAAAGALEDRLRSMAMVDEFFAENVTEQTLIQAKDHKWLSNDLMIYLNVLPELEDIERREQMRAMILDFAKGVDAGAYERIDALDRIKYRLLEQGDYDKLGEAVAFAKERYDDARATVAEDGQYHGSFDFDDLPEDLSVMTPEIVSRGLQTSIKRVILKDEGLSIEGTLKLRGVLTGPDDQYELALTLHPIENADHQETALDIAELEVRPEEGADQGEAARHECRFLARLSADQLAALEDDTYKLATEVTYNGLPLDRTMLRNPVNARRAKPYAYSSEGRITTVLYNTLRELKLGVEELKSPVITGISDTGTCIEATDDNGVVHEIAYDDIDFENHRIGDPMERPYYFLALDPIACPSKNGILRMSRISSGQPYMTFIEKGALLLDAYLEDTMLSLAVKTSKSMHASGKLRYVFVDEDENVLPAPILMSTAYDGLHVLEIDFRKLHRYHLDEKGELTLHILDGAGRTCPLVRDPSSCKKLDETIACKGWEYELAVTNAGCKIEATIVSTSKKRWKKVTKKVTGKR